MIGYKVNVLQIETSRMKLKNQRKKKRKGLLKNYFKDLD